MGQLGVIIGYWSYLVGIRIILNLFLYTTIVQLHVITSGNVAKMHSIQSIYTDRSLLLLLCRRHAIPLVHNPHSYLSPFVAVFLAQIIASNKQNPVIKIHSGRHKICYGVAVPEIRPFPLLSGTFSVDRLLVPGKRM